MACWQWGDAAAAHLVVCVHGLSRQGRDFDVLARALLARAAARGQSLRVVCPDVVGRGESDWLKEPMGYQFPTYVGDMLTLLGTLAQQAPIGRFDWVGTSMGGLIGLMLAGAPDLPLPAPLRRLVLNDVGPALDPRGLQRIAGYVDGAPLRWATLEEAADALWAVSQGFGPHTRAEWLALCAPQLVDDGHGALVPRSDPAIALPLGAITPELARLGEAAAWQAWDRLRCPTLVLRGADSDILAPATAAAMTQRGPRARVHEFAGVGHAPTLVHADQIEVVRRFLLDP